MSGVTLADLVEAIGTLKAQQNADATVIACLIGALASGDSLDHAWPEFLSISVVDQAMYAQTNAHGKDGLEVFNDRIAYWSEMIKAATVSDE